MDVKRFGIVCGILFLAACGQPKTKETVFEAAASECPGQTNEKRFIVEWENGETTVEESSGVDEFKNSFVTEHLSEIKKVHLDQTLQLLHNIQSDTVATLAVGDPPQDWGQSIVQAESLWSQNILGDGVRVGVVDSLVDTEHVQLKTRIDYNLGEIPNNGIDDDHNGYIDDYAGMVFITDPGPNKKINPHGSHVSGIIAADSSLGPMKGLAPKALIVPAPFISNSSSGSLADAVNALNYMISRQVRIINASWGGSNCVVNTLRNTFEKLSTKGILVVVAAGNSGADLDQSTDYPASFNMPNQITVAASTALDYMASWSNSGFGSVQLAAPGSRIYSTIPGNAYEYFDGTSMAAPFVSGAAALLMSAAPKASIFQIKEALSRGVDITPSHEYRVQSHGRLNIKKSLDYLRSFGL